MLKPRAILHIGLEKTGSTSVQDFLFRNRTALLDRGFLIPVLPTPGHHHELCLMGQDDFPRFLTLRSMTGTIDPSDLDHRRRLVESAVATAAIAPEAAEKVFLFSSELFHSNLLTVQEVEKLHQFLCKYFSEVKILVYLRRQDRLAASLFSSRVGGGEAIPRGLSLAEAIFNFNQVTLPYYFQFDQVLKLYAQVFGYENLAARMFERSRLVGGDAVLDFCDACNIPSDGLVFQRASNESLKPAALTMLMALNSFLPGYLSGRPNPARRRLMRILEQRFAGSGKILGRAEAINIVRICQPSNKELAVFLRLSEDSPFDSNFNEYPEKQPPLPMLSAEHADIIAEFIQESLAD